MRKESGTYGYIRSSSSSESSDSEEANTKKKEKKKKDKRAEKRRATKRALREREGIDDGPNLPLAANKKRGGLVNEIPMDGRKGQ